jgi:hypothetical protein
MCIMPGGKSQSFLVRSRKGFRLKSTCQRWWAFPDTYRTLRIEVCASRQLRKSLPLYDAGQEIGQSRWLFLSLTCIINEL